MFWKILHNATAILPKPLLRLLPQVTQTFLSRPMSSRILPDAELQMRLGRAKNLLGESSNDRNNAPDWMNFLEDATPLSRMSIPGTHDAAAFNYTGPDNNFWNCQSVPLLGQLDLGIRALDLRFGWAKDGKRLLFFHSVACLDEEAELEDVLWGLFDWLNKHPTETLVVSLKRDDAPNEHDAIIQKKIADIMDGKETQDYWFQTPNVIPTLGQVRGKIVLLNRMLLKDEERGIILFNGWESNQPYLEITFNNNSTNAQKALVEDYFLMKGHPGDAEYQINDKETATIAHLDKAKIGASNELWVTFSSAVGDRKGSASEDVTPKVMATGRGNIPGINERLIKWSEKNKGTGAGIVFMDFIASDPKLIKSFIPSKPTNQ